MNCFVIFSLFFGKRGSESESDLSARSQMLGRSVSEFKGGRSFASHWESILELR